MQVMYCKLSSEYCMDSRMNINFILNLQITFFCIVVLAELQVDGGAAQKGYCAVV